MSDPETDLMVAHLENKRIEGAAEYARRGRPLAAMSDEDLHRDWLIAFKAWAASERDGKKYDHRAQEDMEAEMYLRGNDPPLNLVKEEITTLRVASQRRLNQFNRDPQKLIELDRQLGEDLAAFAQSIDDTKKN
jgi:hypothetical protein